MLFGNRRSVAAIMATIAATVAAASPAQIREPDVSIEATTQAAYLRRQSDVTAVSQVVLRERQARDRGWWEQMRAAYWPDSRVDLSWYHGDGPGFVQGSKRQYDGGARPVHRLFAPVVEINGDKAFVEVATESFSRHVIGGKQALVTSAMRLNYRLEKRSGDWRILYMTPIYEHANAIPVTPGETISIPASELARYRSSYAVLSYALAQRGIAASLEELGDDRPEPVQKFYAATREWLDRP